MLTRGDPVIGGISGQPGHVTITPVYWAPPGYSFAATYRSVINGYIADVAAASRHDANVFSVATQYYQQASTAGATPQSIDYSVQAGQEVDDANAFPAMGGVAGCTADVGFSACVTDGELQTELGSLTSLGVKADDSHLYLVFFPKAVETCISPGTAAAGSSCSTNHYCAYHSGTNANLVYTNQPYPDLSDCVDPANGAQAPNGDVAADAQVSLISHEANEAITDWAGAWSDSAGYEDGDECAYVYGTPLGGSPGTFYNQVIGGGHYYTQDEFSNEDFAKGTGDPASAGGVAVPGCVQREEAPTATFTVPATITAGLAATFDGSAASDPDNAAALTFSWAWGDGTSASSGVQPSHTFAAVGTYTVTLTVTDGDGWQGSTSKSVIVAAPPAGPCTSVNVTSDKSSPQPAGTKVSLAAVAAVCTQPEYEIWMLAPSAGAYTKVQAYSTSATYSWDTAGLASGTYSFTVFAKDANSGGTASNAVATWDAYTTTTFSVTATPCGAVAMSASPASPQVVGATVGFTATATACSKPRYEFWMLAPGAGSYVKVQAYSFVPTYTWPTTGRTPGVYHVIVFTRDASSAGTSSNSVATWDTYVSAAYQITANAVCTGVVLTTAPPGSAAAGTPVTITASASGCPKPLYEFWMLAPGSQTWVKRQAYSTSPSYAWSTVGVARGPYRWIVFVRDQSSAGVSSNQVARWDSYSMLSYSLS